MCSCDVSVVVVGRAATQGGDFATSGEHDRGTLGGTRARNLLADTSSCSGDERHLPLQSMHAYRVTSRSLATNASRCWSPMPMILSW